MKNSSENRSKIIDVQKENAVIACLLREPNLIYDYDLCSGDFYNPITRDIFSILLEIQRSSGESELDFTPLQIQSAAKRLGVSIAIDNLQYLWDATGEDGLVKIGSLGAYVRDIKDVGLRIKLSNTADDISTLAFDLKRNAADAVSAAETKIIDLEDNISEQVEPIQIGSLLDADLEECRTRVETGLEPGIMTGIRQFDDATGGAKKGSLSIFAARAKTGKSLLAINIAWNVYKRYGNQYPILYLDTEMSTSEVSMRLMSIVSGINHRHIERGDLSPAEWRRVSEAKEIIKKIPFHHVYLPDFNQDNVIRLVRKWKRMKNIGLVIFDYLKLPDATSINGNVAEYQALGFLANTLKNSIAGRLQLPVIAFAQLNRTGVTQARDGLPDETSLSGSDRIAHYCSTLAIFRKASETEMYAVEADAPEYKRYGAFGNRYLHIILTRAGGDDCPPIPLFLNGTDLSIIESGEVIPNGSDTPLSVTISKQIARDADKESGS